MPRSYAPYPEKHKRPKGFGSLCPKMAPDDVEALAGQAIAVDGVGQNKLWIARGQWCFCLHPSAAAGDDTWHGFPVVGGDVDERVLDALEEGGFLTKRERRALAKQRVLPEQGP